MSIQTEIARLTTLRNTLRTKLSALGLVAASATLDTCVTAISGITKKAAASYIPGTVNQTIAAGQYLAGAQTVSGDANLVADNIKSGVSIFGVQGTHSGGAANAKRWEITLPSDLVSTASPILTDSFLADNADNEELTVVILAKNPIVTTKNAGYTFISSNHMLLNNSGNVVYGLATRLSTSGSVNASVFRRVPLNNSSTGLDMFHIYLRSSGRLTGCFNTNYPMVAGDYTVIAYY